MHRSAVSVFKNFQVIRLTLLRTKNIISVIGSMKGTNTFEDKNNPKFVATI